MRVELESLVGRREIAEMLGIEVDTVKRYRLQGEMPEPLAEISGTHLWRRSDIERWAAKRRPYTKKAA